LIPKRLPYARFDSDGTRYCVTDDWADVSNATWHFHMLNVYPGVKWEEA